jgi:DNA primase
VKAAALPKGKDPADLVSEDPAEFGKRIKEAKPVVDFFLTEIGMEEHDPHRLLRAAEHIVLPLIQAMQSPMERDHFTENAARTLGISAESVKESLKRLPKYESVPDGTTMERKAAPVARSTAALRADQVLAVVHAYPGTELADEVKSEYLRITGAHQVPALVPPESALFYAEQTFGEKPGRGAADELIRAFEEAVIREAHQKAVMDLRKAEAAGDPAAIENASAACAKLSARLSALGV